MNDRPWAIHSIEYLGGSPRLEVHVQMQNDILISSKRSILAHVNITVIGRLGDAYISYWFIAKSIKGTSVEVFDGMTLVKK